MQGRRTVGLLALVVLVALAPAAGAAGVTVKVSNAGYAPASVTVPVGTRVTWSFTQGTHSVTDATRLGLYGSGARSSGTYPYVFIDAGTYPYRSTVGTAMTGTVVVPMTLSPATGTRTTTFAVRWGSDYSPSGYGELVQIKPPGTAGWQSFVFGTPASNATFRPTDWGNRTGSYQFRAKLIKGTSTSVSSGWSPVASVSVR